jgi:replicative DNA helicase
MAQPDMTLPDGRPARPRPVRPAAEGEAGSGVGFDRQPPQDLGAEQSVLGGMLLSKDAIADVVEVLRPDDFYRPAHQTVYETILDLYGRGEPADAITVSSELQRRGDLIRLGGLPYLHTLIATVPTAANAAFYAEIVAEKAVLRRLVEAGTRIVQLGYHGDQGAEVNEIVDRAQAAIYDVTERSTSEDYVPLEELLQPTMDEIDAIASRGGVALGVPTGFVDLDAATNGLHPGQMIVVAARPGLGKSTLGLDFARSCSVRHGLTSAVFSLEMSKSEIVMRLLSAEARIRLADMRAGRMSDDDWTRMARRMSEISEAPLFIDDSPNLTLMEIRAKARRLKQRHDLKLVILDYLQLMTSGRRVESRQQEVSEFSRQIKLLAKELEVPVVAISQLNRGPEQRTDKRPMLSDLRESGCLTVDTRLLRADTGAEVTLGELLESGARDVPLWSLDERLRLVSRPMSSVFSSGVKEVFRLQLASGREVRATGNHPFLTVDGWCPLTELTVGDGLAAPRRVPVPVCPESLPAERIVLLAQLIGSAATVRQPLRSARPAPGSSAEDVAPPAGVAPRVDGGVGGRAAGTALRLPAPFHLTPGRHNALANWVERLGLVGVRAHRRFVPEPVFALPDAELALFLRQLWAVDGTVGWDARARRGRVAFTSTSRRLVDDVSRLLLRFGVLGRIGRTRKAVSRDRWHLRITESEHQRLFVRSIGVHPEQRAAARHIDRDLQQIADDTPVDTIPDQVWGRVQQVLAARRMTHAGLDAARGSRFCGRTGWRHAPSRSRLALASALLQDAELELAAVNDVYWDPIVEITSLGEQAVYDATVPGTHNFVADGIAVHNSIEQDADMVILLHRPDAFERDDPRAGEADLILAKHRNGPTSTITVAHQLHYSRFADLAHG